MKCNIIGAGRLGKQLAKTLASKELVEISAICNQSLASTKKVIKALGLENTASLHSLKELPLADIIFITVPDDQIALVVKIIEQTVVLQTGCFIIHCSGALSSTILSPLKAKGCQIASLHPLKAFKKGEIQADAFSQVDCIIEGDDAVVKWLSSLCYQMNARPASITVAQKPAYHAAAVIASNYLVTLAETASRLMSQAGLKKKEAFPMICRLMQSSLDNLKQASEPEHALTGPIVRGDHSTIAKHLKAIKPQLDRELYKAMGRATLPLTALTEEKKQALAQLFESDT